MNSIDSQFPQMPEVRIARLEEENEERIRIQRGVKYELRSISVPLTVEAQGGGK